MNNLLKKIVASVTAITCAVWMMGPGVAQALTAEELQDQIEALQDQLADLQTQLAEKTGETPTGGEIPTVCEGITFDRHLAQGMSGDDVKCLQAALNQDLDPDIAESGPGSSGSETSYFGPITKAGVIRFQEKYADEVLGPWDLTEGTGYVGDTTIDKLSSLLEAWGEKEEEEEEEPSDFTTEAECEDAGYYWYDEACHAEEQEVEEGLTVALSADTPASTTLLDDSTSGTAPPAQVLGDMTTFTFTNGDADEIKVTTLKVHRSGISSDSDISNIYLYEGDTKLADYNSFTDKVVTFSDSDGLFSIGSGDTKDITVKADIANGAGTVASIKFGINSADDIETDASSVNGDFPLTGNKMEVTTVSDLGYANISSYTTFPATVDPGVNDYEFWRFTATAQSQDIDIEKMVMTLVGTVDNDDVQNLYLEVDGSAVTEEINVDSSGKLTFDFSDDPYSISKGQSKIFVLKGDVIDGTNRAFKFTLRKNTDFVTKDTEYGVYTSSTVGGSAWSVVDPDSAGDGTNINTGNLTVNVSSDSPSGNVAKGATNVTLAEFDFTAYGEDVKITQMAMKVDEEGNDKDIDAGKLYFNGSQVGSTDDDVADEGTVTSEYSSLNVIVPAGETATFAYKADITYNDGTDLAAGQTIVVEIVGAQCTASGKSSLSSVTVSSATARTLTVASGALSVAKNNAMSDYTSSIPTGVKGAAEKKVGSFVITAGAGEGVTITQMKVGDDGDDGTSDFGANFQNLKLMHDSTQLGTTVSNPSNTEGVDYTFSVSPAITLSAGEQYVVDAYADILSNASGYTSAEVGLEAVSVSATGVDTSSDASWSGPTDLQKLVISTGGSLTISAAPSPTTPTAGQLVMGSEGNTFVVLSLKAGSAEDVEMTRIEISDDTTNFGGNLSNIELYDSVGNQVGSTIASLDSTNDAEFNLATPWTIPAGETKYLVVKADVNSYPNAVSGAAHALSLAGNGDIDSMGAVSGSAISETVSGATGNAQDVYRTKVTVAANSATPSGSQTAGADSEVLRFDVTADSNYTAAFSSAALSTSGSMDTTGNGNANLYDAADLSTALATESYTTVTFEDISGADGGSEYTFQNVDAPAAIDGIPVGATVRIYDDDASAYLSGTFVVSKAEQGDFDGDGDTNDTRITFSSPPTTDLDASDILYYRPLQPGSGKLYFGGHTVLTANIADTDTSASVSNLNGFAIGDNITIKGYDTNGNSVSGTATIKDLASNTITFDSGITLSATIVYNHLGTPSNAQTQKHTSTAVVYTGTETYGAINDLVSAGETITYVVKGDTTGATSNENFRADINSASDLIWNDRLHYTVDTDTNTFPVTGGTLSY